MRKIDIQVANAIHYGDNFKGGNTEVLHLREICLIYLHGNLIARRLANRTLVLYTCGYHTRTSCARLNAVLAGCGFDGAARIRNGCIELVGHNPKRVTLE